MYKITGERSSPEEGHKVTLEDEYGGSYTLEVDDKCVVLRNNNDGKLATHFFREAVEAIKLLTGFECKECEIKDGQLSTEVQE